MAKNRNKKPRHTATPESIIADYPLEAQELAGHLRRAIHTLLPGVLETAYPGWRGIGYKYPGVGYFCGIFFRPSEPTIRLGLEHGTSLPDPDGLLEGEGKRVRYITITRPEQIESGGVKRLLKAAVGR